MMNLGANLTKFNNLKEAETLLRECIKMMNRIMHPNDPTIATAIQNLGVTFLFQNKLNDAEI
jgi:hypothetical protein